MNEPTRRAKVLKDNKSQNLRSLFGLAFGLAFSVFMEIYLLNNDVMLYPLIVFFALFIVIAIICGIDEINIYLKIRKDIKETRTITLETKVTHIHKLYSRYEGYSYDIRIDENAIKVKKLHLSYLPNGLNTGDQIQVTFTAHAHVVFHLVNKSKTPNTISIAF